MKRSADWFWEKRGAVEGLRALVLKRLGQVGEASAVELAGSLPAKPATISARLDELQAEGKVVQVRRVASGRPGRPATVWQLATVIDRQPADLEAIGERGGQSADQVRQLDLPI